MPRSNGYLWRRPNCSPDRLFLCFSDEGLGPTLDVGTNFEVHVKMEVQPEDIQGWLVGVTYDTERLELLEVATDNLDLPDLFLDTTTQAHGNSSGPSQQHSACALSPSVATENKSFPNSFVAMPTTIPK